MRIRRAGSNNLRVGLAERGTAAVIPSKRNRKVHRDSDQAIYKQPNVVERLASMIPRIIAPALSRLEGWSMGATRFDRNIKTSWPPSPSLLPSSGGSNKS